MDDLRALLGFVAENRKLISTQYGLVNTQSVAAIQRALLSLEREGGDILYGEPALQISDLLRTDLNGRGIINILAADQLILKPRLYSSFLLWLLSELFENLPEVGDTDKPKLVFFFDEAHLLFDDAPDVLLQRVSRSFALSVPRAWACISVPSSRMMRPRDIGTTRQPHPACVRATPATRRRSEPQRKPLWRIRNLMWLQPYPNWGARRWFPPSRIRVYPCRWNEPLSSAAL